MEKQKRKICIVTQNHWGSYYAVLNKMKYGDKDTVIVAIKPDLEKYNTPEKLAQVMSIGKGLYPVFKLEEIMAKRAKMKDWYFIWDANHNVDENELLRKEGFKVFAGGKFNYDCEEDRGFAIKLAAEYGFDIPEWKEFTNKEDGIKWMESKPDEAFVFKPNGKDSYLTTVPIQSDPCEANEMMREFISCMDINDFVLQEKKKGIEINVQVTCVNGEVKEAQLMLETKRISSSDKGRLCGCAFDFVKDIDINSKLIQMTIAKFFPLIKKMNYTGFFDTNCLIGEDGIWFLEFCQRFGYNQSVNYFINLCKEDCLNAICDMVDGTYENESRRGWGASVTAIVDYPHKGIPIKFPDCIKDKVFLSDGYKKGDTICQSGCMNDLAYVCGQGFTMEEAMKTALDNMEKMAQCTINLDYRDDGDKKCYQSSPIKRYEALMELGLV